MFECYLAPPPRPGRLRSALVAGSVIGHAGVVVAILIAGLWKIERLALEEPPLVPVYRGGAVAIGGGDDAGEPAPRLRRPRAQSDSLDRRRRVKEPAQPGHDTAATETGPDGGGADVGSDTGSPDGDGDGDGTGDGAGGWGLGTCTEGPCGPPSAIGPADPSRIPPPPRREHVAARDLDGYRIEGNPRITPPDQVRAVIAGDRRELKVVVKMCLDDGGRIDGLTLIRSSGFDAYDQKILREMRTWRYRPYVRAGRPVAVCSPVTFVYRMR